MLFEGFLHPALLWGTALASVPLLIHLLNRQRHRPLRWAAMQFVLAAYKRTHRRAQLENLILLLLRMAAVALLALAIARPFTGTDSPLAPLTESRRDLVLVLDVSASTGYRESVQSVHETILDRARELLEEFDGTRGDRVRLVAAGLHPRLVSARSPEDALALLSTLSAPTDEALDLAAALALVADFAEEDAAATGQGALEVRLLSDLQKRSFLPRWGGAPTTDTAAPEGTAPPLVRALDLLDQLGVPVVVEDLGAGTVMPANLGIDEVTPLRELLGPGLPTEIGVRVRNHGSVGRAAVRVALEVDGVRQPSQKVDVAARSAADVVFVVLFRDSGAHTLVARLEGDGLAVDDARATVVHVPPSVRVLLVNGDPHPEIDRDEIGYLRTVLEPPDDGALPGWGSLYAPFVASVRNAAAFGADDLDLGNYDVILLANVGSVSARMIERLETRIAAGGGLILTLGDHVADRSAIDAWNARGWRADGSGLLPARLFRAVEVSSRDEAYYRCAWFVEDHPALSFFADERWRPFLTEVPIYAFVATEPVESALVLARLDDEGQNPLLVEREYGRGRVILWTTSIDRDWNRVAELPTTLIPLMHELLRHAGRAPAPVRNAEVGAALALEIDAFPRNPILVRPDGSRRPLDGEPAEVAEGLWRLPAVTPDRAGLWHVEWEGTDVPFAVQLDPGESDLERIAHPELLTSHSAWRIWRATDDRAEEDERPQRGELWRWLAGLALAALVLETLWSAWIGRERRLA